MASFQLNKILRCARASVAVAMIGVGPLSSVAHAQSRTSAANTMEHVFVAAGVMTGVDDSGHRTTFGLPVLQRPPVALTIILGGWLTQHVGVGVEIFRPGSVATGYSVQNPIVKVDQTENEIALTFTARVRAWRRSRVTMAITSGIGPLWQDTVTVETGTNASHELFTRTTTASKTTKAWLSGLDTTVTVGTHLAVSPVMRVYWFSRDRTRDDFESYGSSTRVLLGVLAYVEF